MSDEEKEAIEILKLYFGDNPTLNITKYVNIVLNLIEKQSKEIEEYKECERLSKRQLEKQKNDIETLKIEIEELKEVKWYYEISRVPKDKIKEILGIEEDIDNEKLLSLLQTIVDENARLEDIEDKKVQIEYSNVFNKGVKSVEDKIKAKMKEKEWSLENYDCTKSNYKQSQAIGAWVVLQSLLEKE